MAIKKSEIYSQIWAACDKLRGGVEPARYKDYILTLLFVKYVSDRFKSSDNWDIEVPEGGSFDDIVALKYKKNIGEGINVIIGKLAEANDLKGIIDIADFNSEELGTDKEAVDKLSGLVEIFLKPELDFTNNRAGGDDILGDAYEFLMRKFAQDSGKSYKCHKKIKHTPDQWKVFEDTHEAIIGKETFEIVQKIRAGKRRPTRMGEMPMFSGLLYCADCGSKLTFHRKADEPAEKHHYVCGNYRSNTSNCTMHYIRNVVVERIVLENLKEVIHYVSNYEDEFVRMVMDADVRQKNRELAQKKKKLIELQKRIGELDTIFQRIYEDNIVGKLSDERFMKMSKGYEGEQRTLQAEADIIQNELQQEEKKSVDVKRFLAIVKKYTDLTELTPEILREFVDKIIVHAPDKSSGRRLQEIEIIYNHIGEFDHSKVTLWKGNAV